MPGHDRGWKLFEGSCWRCWRLLGLARKGHSSRACPTSWPRAGQPQPPWQPKPQPKHWAPCWGLGMGQGWTGTWAYQWGSCLTSTEDCHGHCCAASVAESRRGTRSRGPSLKAGPKLKQFQNACKCYSPIKLLFSWGKVWGGFAIFMQSSLSFNLRFAPVKIKTVWYLTAETPPVKTVSRWC